jgi:LuxR family maltose regulon positive regulatory protein
MSGDVSLGDAAWGHWLSTHVSFTFESFFGRFTARKEHRAGRGYWYAYRKVEGRLYKVYLGADNQLTSEHLNNAGYKLRAE